MADSKKINDLIAELQRLLPHDFEADALRTHYVFGDEIYYDDDVTNMLIASARDAYVREVGRKEYVTDDHFFAGELFFDGPTQWRLFDRDVLVEAAQLLFNRVVKVIDEYTEAGHILMAQDGFSGEAFVWARQTDTSVEQLTYLIDALSKNPAAQEADRNRLLDEDVANLMAKNNYTVEDLQAAMERLQQQEKK